MRNPEVPVGRIIVADQRQAVGSDGDRSKLTDVTFAGEYGGLC